MSDLKTNQLNRMGGQEEYHQLLRVRKRPKKGKKGALTFS